MNLPAETVFLILVKLTVLLLVALAISPLVKSPAQRATIWTLVFLPDRDEVLTIPGALESSCNTCFMHLANRVGADSLGQTGRMFRFGESNLKELPVGESSWMADGHPRTELGLAMASLGQGPALMTPLDVNTMTSAIATGTWPQPYLVEDNQPERRSEALVGQGELTGDSLDLIRQGMIAVIHGERGTAKRARVEGHIVAGKTGTAQMARNRRHGWFTGFAPAEAPEYTATLSIEGVDTAGRDIAPLAGELLEHLLD